MPEDVSLARPSIAYDRSGKGPPLIFLHGLTYDRRLWVPVIEYLRDSFTCVNVDLPGHGMSLAAPTYDLEAVAGDVRQLVERLELVKPMLIGHSVGAMIAAIYASTYPNSGLITSDQTLKTVTFLHRLHALKHSLRGPAFLGIWRSIEAQLGIDLIPESRRMLVTQASNPQQDVVLGYWREPLDVPPEELSARLDGIVSHCKAPFTAIFGERVEPDYRAWLSATMPQCSVVIFENGGHFPQLVDPQRFSGEVRALARKPVET